MPNTALLNHIATIAKVGFRFASRSRLSRVPIESIASDMIGNFFGVQERRSGEEQLGFVHYISCWQLPYLEAGDFCVVDPATLEFAGQLCDALLRELSEHNELPVAAGASLDALRRMAQRAFPATGNDNPDVQEVRLRAGLPRTGVWEN